MHQVVVNLCTSAAQCLSAEGGTIEINVERVDVPGGVTDRPRTSLDEGAYVQLRVSDTGPGVAPDLVERIFDPFFTTKKPGDGAGLGLAVVEGIVQSHRGAIDVTSRPRERTTFSVYLALAEGVVEATDEPDQVAGGDECNLLVDDESSILRAVQKMFASLGYEVLAASSRVDALAAFRQDPTRFDLVITDQTMPKMTGDALAPELLSTRPDIPIILCTGYSSRVTDAKAKELGIRGFLAKPTPINEYARKVRAVLDGAPKR